MTAGAQPSAPGPFQPVHQLFADAAADAPEAIAVAVESATGDERVVPYGILLGAARSLSRRLAARGVGPGQTVAVLLEPEPELVVAFLGILGTGAGYLALDPGQPEERIAANLAAAGARHLLTRGALLARPDLERIFGARSREMRSGSEQPRPKLLPGAVQPRGAAGVDRGDAVEGSAAGALEILVIDEADEAAMGPEPPPTPTDPASPACRVERVEQEAAGMPASLAVEEKPEDARRRPTRKSAPGATRQVTVSQGKLARIAATAVGEAAPGDRVALRTSPTEEPSLPEIWPALTHGATLVLPPLPPAVRPFPEQG